MSQFFFGPFRFDAQALLLEKHGQKVKLRPKAALVLAALVIRPGEVVSKRALSLTAWGDRPVQDETLFQTVSHLRKALAPMDAIVTIPNVGYRLTVPVVDRASAAARPAVKRIQFMAIAAGAAILLMGGSSALVSPGSARVHTPPALQAFSLGLAHLDQPRLAQRYFEMAVRESDSLLEARLMLSEALLSQGQVEASRAAVEGLLEAARDQHRFGLQASTMHLLSRLSEAAGQRVQALEWARRARDTAARNGLACAIRHGNRRIIELAGENQLPASPAQPDAAQRPGLEVDSDSVAEVCREILFRPPTDDELFVQSASDLLPPGPA